MQTPTTLRPRRSGRAARMAPDERRQAIVDVVVPLLLQHGDAVTTKQIAEAAGIAEGTIFRVFPDKAALLMAAAEETMNPTDGGAELEAALAGHDDLRERVGVTTEPMIERSDRVIAVMMALRRSSVPKPRRRGHAGGPPAFRGEANQTRQPMLPRFFEPPRGELSVDPSTAATVLRPLVLGSRHPGVAPDTRLTA